MAHKPIEEFDFFLDFEEVADQIWTVVHSWHPLDQDTLGKQLIRAIDSVGANLSEGDGRYSAADGLRHFVISRGSAREAMLWVSRASRRSLIDPALAQDWVKKIESASKRLNLLMTYRRNNMNQVREAAFPYDAGAGRDDESAGQAFDQP